MRTVVVGLLVDPGWPTKIAERIVESLPDVLSEQVSNDVNWDAQLLTKALPLDESGNVEVWQHSDSLMEENGWDLMVCLTELTRRLGDKFFISDLNISRRVALISLPALGPVRISRHARTAVVRVVRALYQGDLTPDEEVAHGRAELRRPKLTGIGGRIQHEVTENEGMTDSYIALSGVGGTARLIAGMVYINKPWMLVPSLDKAIAAAMATAGFGIFYSSVWTMADAISLGRMSLISAFVTTAMLGWLIIHNDLWQREEELPTGGSPTIYNVSTVVTVAIGVLCTYAVLLGLTLLGALTIIPSSYMASTLGHEVGFGDYVTLAWFVSSMGTLAGALGSSFESDEAIQRATYGRREWERHAVTRKVDNY